MEDTGDHFEVQEQRNPGSGSGATEGRFVFVRYA